ncbi:CEP78-like protein, partial [Mya arenaria]
HQGTRRHNEAWRDSLRYRRPDLDRMPGIRRITINNNPMIGDQGAALLAEALKDDLWLKALDMQGNGISSTGAKALLDVLKYNTTLVVLDVRRNPLIDRDLVHAIMEQLMINCNGQDTEETTDKDTEQQLWEENHHQKDVKSGPGLPWRTAARANRYRGYPPEHVPGHTSLMERTEKSPSSSFIHQNQTMTTIDDDDDGEETEETEDSLQEHFDRIKLDDSAMSTAVTGGKGAKLTLENKKVREENSRMKRSKGSILDDDSVLESIEASFKQFHELGKLITMAGLDAEDSPFNNTTRDHMPRFQKSFSKNGFSGDISGNSQINGSFGSDGKQLNGNARRKPYLKSHQDDPTMKNSYLDETNEHEEAQRKRDELYERILQETSHAFRNIGEQDVTMNITGDTTRTQNETADDSKLDESNVDNESGYHKIGKFGTPEKSGKSRIPRLGGTRKQGGDIDSSQDRSELLDSIKGPSGEIIMTLSPFDDEIQTPGVSPGRRDDDDESGGASPDKGNRPSDYSYGMDSFEQSYLSERGEVVHLGDDLDFYPDSPSPIRQDSDNEDF